jgi:hypothetical protein
MRNLVLKYGGLIAAILTVVMLVPLAFQSTDEMIANMELGEIVGYATMIVAMGLVYFALREHRNRNLGGVMGFRTGFLTGLAVSAVAALLFGAATALLYAWLGPDRTHEFMQAYVIHSLGPSATPDDVSAALAAYESQRGLWGNPLFQGFVMVATVFPIGLVVSLVSAAALRARN